MVELLTNPDEIRLRRGATDVYLFYPFVARARRICAVVRRLKANGFLATTYPCDATKMEKWNGTRKCMLEGKGTATLAR